MKCEFWATGNFVVLDGKSGNYRDDSPHFSNLQDAVDYIEENWIEGDGCDADIVSGDTGEILLHFEDETDYDDWSDDVDESFYNPYMGCDDFDL